MPLGPYDNKNYFWEKGEIKTSDSGPSLIIPPFLIDGANADDKRMWGNIAFNEWGLKYK